MFNYDLGGNVVNPEVSETMAEIAPNKTLFVQKLTANDPIKPQVVNIQTVEEAFEVFKPNVDVEFNNKMEQPLKKILSFLMSGLSV